jgi:hypothetical protein
MTETITLVCPEGAFDAPISDGSQEFFPYRADHRSDYPRDWGGPWLVDVPIHVAHHFLGRGGFSVMAQDEPPAVPTNMVRLRKIDGTAPPWGDYVPEDDGTIVVPYDHHALVLLESHGYELLHVVDAQPEPAEEVKEPGKVEAKVDEPPSLKSLDEVRAEMRRIPKR